METLSEASFRDQWILERLEAGELEMDFTITEDGELSSTALLQQNNSGGTIDS